MRRIAAHYVYWRQLHKMSYIELNDDNTFNGVFPLQDEIAGTAFYDGLLVPVDKPEQLIRLNGFSDLFRQLEQSGITENISVGSRVYLYRIHNNKIYAV